MILDFIEKVQNPMCDISAGLGSIIGGAMNSITSAATTAATNKANREMTEATNQANLDIANATNESNERIADKTNAFNAAQADLAYQRSTASSKMSELMAAGLSMQQAKQLIASQGSTSSMTPASGVSAPQVAPTMQAPQIDNSGYLQAAQSAGSVFETLGRSLGEGYKSEYGGELGLLSSSTAFSSVVDHLNEAPASAFTDIKAFQNYCNSENASEFFKNFGKSDDYKKLIRHPLSMRGFMYQIKQWLSSSANNEQSVEANNLAIRMQRMQLIGQDLQNEKILQEIFNIYFDTQETIENTNNIAASTENIYADVTKKAVETQVLTVQGMRAEEELKNYKKLAPHLLKADIASANAIYEQMTLDTRLYSDPTYRNLYVNSKTNEVGFLTQMYQYSEYLAKGKSDYLNQNPECAAMLSVFSLMSEAGVENTDLFKLVVNYAGSETLFDNIAKDIKLDMTPGSTTYGKLINTQTQEVWNAEKGIFETKEDYMRHSREKENLFTTGTGIIRDGFNNGAKIATSAAQALIFKK